jgi:hypothetical protein
MMMKLLDFFMKGIFVYMRSRPKEGTQATIMAFSSIAAYSIFALVSILFSMIGLSLLNMIDVLGSIVFGVMVYFGTSFLLTKIYVREHRELQFTGGKSKLTFFYLLGPLMFIFSIVLLFASLRN